MTISIIIPAARPKLLAQLLESLRGQIFDRPLEIIVVDGRPGGDPDDLSFCTTRFGCRLLRGEGRGPARARNLGAAHAKGTYLLFLDDDAKVDRLYLARILKEIEARPNHAVSGMQVAINRRNSFSCASEWMLNRFIDEECSKFAPSNGLALRRADFERCGGFDSYFPLAAGEDREFCARWTAAGFRMIFLKGASIEHHFPESFASLMKQQWRYGRGALHFKKRVPPQQGPHVRSAGFYLRMIAEAPRRYGLARGSLVGMLCVISQGIIACGYLRERIWPSSDARQAVAAVEAAPAE
jgi:GT2 family glycosyltransferase